MIETLKKLNTRINGIVLFKKIMHLSQSVIDMLTNNTSVHTFRSFVVNNHTITIHFDCNPEQQNTTQLLTSIQGDDYLCVVDNIRDKCDLVSFLQNQNDAKSSASYDQLADTYILYLALKNGTEKGYYLKNETKKY